MSSQCHHINVLNKWVWNVSQELKDLLNVESNSGYRGEK